MRPQRLFTAVIAACAALLTVACESETKPGAPAEAKEATAPVKCARTADPAAAAAFEQAAIASAQASRGAGSPVIWTLKDEDSTIHILGTVHLLRPDLAWRSPEIDAAMDAAETVVFEADTSSPEAGRELMKFVTTAGMFTDGAQLTNLMTEEDVAILEEALQGIGLPIDAIQPMKPWYAAITLSVMQLTQEGFDPEAGVETTIENEVAAHGATFEYLETVEQQLGAFARLDNCTQVEFLMQTASSMDEGTEVLDMLVAEWADGDVAGLGALMASPEAFGSEAAYDALLKDRNARWVPQISGMLETPGTRLVAVGAGHLAGADSVIAMLRAEGYEVTGP